MIAPRRPRARPRRRGSAYVLVLSVALIVVVIGLSGLALTRVEGRTTGLEQDWHQAGYLAESAVEHALRTISGDIWWREVNAGYEADFSPEVSIGPGLVSWRFEDVVDSDLADEPSDPIRVHGRARIGGATRIYSVVAWPDGQPLDVLRTALHATGDLEVDAVLDVRGGPASANADILVGGSQIVGDAEATLVDVPANVTGSVTSGAPVKPMPSVALWAVYKSRSTELKYGDIVNHTGGNVTGVVLGPAHNPFKAGDTNADGLYLVKVPESTQLRVRSCRIEGTLLVELDREGSRLEIGPEVVWKSYRPDFPALIVYTTKDVSNTVSITCDGDLDEFGTGVNFNPVHTPYYGDADNDTTDTYAATIRGLVHVIRDVGLFPSSRTEIHAPRRITGCIVADGDVRITGSSVIVADATLLSRSPLGYTTTRAPGNLLRNGDMEQGLTAWSPVGGATTLASDGGAHSGAACIKVEDRATAARGIKQDITAVVTSGVAHASDLWLEMRDDPEDVEIAIEIDSSGEGVQKFVVGVAGVQKSWTRVTAVHVPTWTGVLNAARWIVTTTTTNQDFSIDDALLAPPTPGPPDPPVTIIPGTWRTEAAP